MSKLYNIILVLIILISVSHQEQFGHSLLGDFSMTNGYVNVNSGSYGVSPKQVTQAKFDYILQSEANSDVWFRKEVEDKLNQVREQIASYVNAKSSEEIVFIENASDGFNSVVKSQNIFQWQKGDVILSTTISYSMVKKTISFLESQFGVKNVLVEFDLNDIQTQDNLYNAWVRTVEQNPGIKMAVLDHISSTPALIFPIERIIKYLHSKGIIVVVDGAHAVGQIQLDLQKYNADFYFSNFYKWGYAPKSVSFLQINTSKFADKIHPNIIGKFYEQGWQREFFWTGTRDFSNYLAVSDALKFRNELGEQKILNYMQELCQEVQYKVGDIWGTQGMVKDKNLNAGMINVRFPSNSFEQAQRVSNLLFDQQGIFTVLVDFEDKPYMRFSCQIFNEIEDYVKVAHWLKKYLKQDIAQQQKTDLL